MAAFLLEIGVEEIPAGMIAAAQAELVERVEKLLRRERLASDDLRVIGYSTPRRLAMIAVSVRPKQADLEEEVVGPSTKVAFRDGVPTPAAAAFAKKSGVDVSSLKTIQNAKGEYVAATVRYAGRAAAEVLTDVLPGEIGGMYWPKTMAWRAGRSERFVRPVRWLVALLDKEILPLEFAGIVADRETYGHRVLHGDAPISISEPREYVEKLASAYVMADSDARKQRIRKALDAVTRTIPGARWREDEALVETVTNLTEWPSVIAGSFDESYLALSEEILVTVMRDHQKYFALEDADGKLLPNFLAVLNIEVDATGATIIRHGNERVLRARFNDARFFWDQDQKIPLVDRVEMLKHVTFHKDLGSYWDKTQWNAQTATGICSELPNLSEDELKAIDLAVKLSKTDLTTEMVKEFTELQGIVGGLYAQAQRYSREVSRAVYEQYRPQGFSDSIPETMCGAVVALTDKMTTIVRMFERGFVPTGSKDPFALRRSGAGVIRILAENESVRYELDLVAVLQASLNEPQWGDAGLRAKVLEFLLDRFEFYLQESVGVRLQVARAVRNSMAASDCDEQYEDVLGYGHIASFANELNRQLGSTSISAVAELLKRTSNILRQAKEKKLSVLASESRALLAAQPEIELAERVTAANAQIQTHYRAGRYADVIEAIAALRQPLNTFFDNVMVMVDDEKLRANRLALLARTEATVRWAADFSELASIQ